MIEENEIILIVLSKVANICNKFKKNTENIHL